MSIKVVATTDVHGFVTESGQPNELFLPLRKKDEILIDNGDFLVGSPLTTYFNTTQPISPLVTLANKVGYDVMVPGNHDFDYGVAYLQAQVAHLDATYVCANAFSLADELLFEPYKILEREGKKVAVIGLITSAMPQISLYRTIQEVKFGDVIEALAYWLPIVREQADLVLVSYHGGIERDMVTEAVTQYDTGEDQSYRILASFPNQIDGLICGHQHRQNAGELYGALFVQPGYRAEVLGQLDYVFAEEKLVEKRASLEQPTIGKTSVTYSMTAYGKWLQQQLDIKKFPNYVAETFAENWFVITLAGETHAEFKNSFAVPYSLSVYHLSGQELLDGLAQRSTAISEVVQLPEVIQPEQSYRILTNGTWLPKYRLEKNYVNNIFDEYLSYLHRFC